MSVCFIFGGILQKRYGNLPICGGGRDGAIGMPGGMGGRIPGVEVVGVDSGALDLGGPIDGGGGGRDPCIPIMHQSVHQSINQSINQSNKKLRMTQIHLEVLAQSQQIWKAEINR